MTVIGEDKVGIIANVSAVLAEAHIPGMTLMALIYTAYGDGGFNTSMRVAGGPEWINTTAFAVGVASREATPRQLRLMLHTSSRNALR